MTKFTAMTLLAVLATTPALAQDTRGESRSEQGSFASAADEGETISPQNRHPGTRRLTFLDPTTGDPLEMGVDEASRWADTVCSGDSILIFDYHEDGSVDESSYDFDCMSDL